MTKIIERPTVSQNDRDETTKQIAVQIAQKKPADVIKRVVKKYPSQFLQIALVPALIAAMAASGGFGMLHQIAEAVMSHDLLGVMTLFLAATYAIQVANAMSQMKEGLRASDHDEQTAELIASLHNMVTEQRNKERQDDALTEKLIDQIDDLKREFIQIHKGDSRVQKNVPKIWSNFARGSTVFIVNGQCRFDVVSERRADGTLFLTPDYDRLINWVKRYGPDGIGRANLVLFVEDIEANSPTYAPAPIAYHLTAFRAVKKLAGAYHAKVHFDKVRIYLLRSGDARRIKSFITGEYGFGGSTTIPFVNSYCDHAAMYNVPRSLLDDDVETCNTPDEVLKYRQLAEALIADQPSYMLADIEQRYGHLVPDVEVDKDFVSRNQGVIPASNASDEIVISGDHMNIPWSPK